MLSMLLLKGAVWTLVTSLDGLIPMLNSLTEYQYTLIGAVCSTPCNPSHTVDAPHML